MATITSLGVGSGLDLTGLLDQLQAAERQKLVPITQQKTTQTNKISAYGRLESSLGRLQESIAELNKASMFNSQKSTVSGDGFMASASETANAGRYEVTVSQLARSGSVASSSVALDQVLTPADTVTELTLNFGATYTDGEFDSEADPLSTKTITLAANSTLAQVRDQINADKEAGVTASIVNDGSGYRLALSSKETGKEASIVSFSGLVSLTMDAATLRAGQDAELNVNGIAITSNSNRIEEAIQGVTLDLVAASPDPVTLTIERDKDVLREAIDNFVSAYNEMKSTVGRMTAFDADSDAAAGELVGDRTVRTIENRLRRDLSDSVAEAGGEFALLSQIGISLDKSGRLIVDDTKLDEAIANNPDGLKTFFAGDTESGGFAGRLNTSLENMRSSDGIVQSSINSAELRKDSLDERMLRMEGSIERNIARYRTQFAGLDSIIAQMNSTSAYLSQQFSMMNRMQSNS